MPKTNTFEHTSTPASKARISLRADIDKLMDYFLLTESVRYQEFAKVWKALNFALIYVGLTDNKDKKEFIIDAFELVSEYLQPPFDIQRRVCALYTLYGLYYTQTYHPRIKIRMCLEDWKETLALHDDLQEQGHLDALYIFHKLRLDKAFKFTATRCPMYYQGRSKKPEDFEKWAAKHQGFMASVLDEDLLQELEQVHVEYQNGKQSCGLQSDASLAIAKDSMSDYIMERITNIDVPREPDSEDEALEDSRMRSSRIRDIKTRSFSSPAKVSRARRTHGTDDSGTDDPSFNPSFSPTRSKGKGRRQKKLGRPKKDNKAASQRQLKSGEIISTKKAQSSKRQLDESSSTGSSSTIMSPLKSLSDVTESGCPVEIATPGKADGPSSSKKKKTIKKVASPNKRKSSANDGEESSPPSKKKKLKSSKKASMPTQVDENSKSKSKKGGQSKKKGVTESQPSKKSKISSSKSTGSKVESKRKDDQPSVSQPSKKPKSRSSKSSVKEVESKKKGQPNVSQSSKKTKSSSLKSTVAKGESKKKEKDSVSHPSKKSKIAEVASKKNTKAIVVKKEQEELSPRKRPRKSIAPRRRVSDDEDIESSGHRTRRSDKAKNV